MREEFFFSCFCHPHIILTNFLALLTRNTMGKFNKGDFHDSMKIFTYVSSCSLLHNKGQRPVMRSKPEFSAVFLFLRQNHQNSFLFFSNDPLILVTNVKVSILNLKNSFIGIGVRYSKREQEKALFGR